MGARQVYLASHTHPLNPPPPPPPPRPAGKPAWIRPTVRVVEVERTATGSQFYYAEQASDYGPMNS